MTIKYHSRELRWELIWREIGKHGNFVVKWKFFQSKKEAKQYIKSLVLNTV